MKLGSRFDLFLLAALWGGSFLFMRVSAPEFGAWALAGVRAAGACALLLPLAWMQGQGGVVRGRFLSLAAVGIVGAALPFLLYGYAAMSLPAGLSAVFNAATPLFGAAVAWLWLGEGLSGWRVAGLGLGFAGVLGLAWSKVQPESAGAAFPLAAVLACLASTVLYGIGASMTKRYLDGLAPLAVAAGSQVGASVLLLPLAASHWPDTMPSAQAWASALALAVLCTGLAYVLFFRLLSEIGPGRAMSVTYLIPVFAMTWGALFLDETISLEMLAGCAVILMGTALASGMWRPVFRRA